MNEPNIYKFPMLVMGVGLKWVGLGLAHLGLVSDGWVAERVDFLTGLVAASLAMYLADWLYRPRKPPANHTDRE